MTFTTILDLDDDALGVILELIVKTKDDLMRFCWTCKRFQQASARKITSLPPSHEKRPWTNDSVKIFHNLQRINFVELDAWHENPITDEGIKGLPLAELILSKNRGITDEGINYVLVSIVVS
eukprot:TRINITY_DN8093_c0_g1_i2.p1 TRINITY_DN8093_c0_g1~~TRINITY_DN8093_c0_g1_i2.p1  ORF type:complete len:122 (-),score=7.69 TRINITY_DN8093_c0_g1_i2:253-618(-)